MELNNTLEQYSYIEGYRPTQADLHVLERLGKTCASLSQYPHLLRWYCHMSSFSQEERKSLPKAGHTHVSSSIGSRREVRQQASDAVNMFLLACLPVLLLMLLLFFFFPHFDFGLILLVVANHGC